MIKQLLTTTALISFISLVHAEPLCQKALHDLNPKVHQKLMKKKTRNGVTLDYVMKSGNENPDSQIGCYAGDADSYYKFAPVFDSVIAEYHNSPMDYRYSSDFNMDGLPALNKKIAEKVVSSRVRVARSLSNYPFESSMNVKQRLKLEKDVLQAINSTLKDTEFGGGKYYSLSKLSQAEKTDLVSRHLLFKEGDKYLQSAGITADWPEGRGAYVSKDERFIIWINEEDHLRIMYMDKGADIATVADKLFTAINSLGRKLKFARSNKFGYLNSCPTNIGSAMRASILVKVADKSEDELKHASKQQGLSVRGTGGEHTAVVGSTYDISYKKRLGDSERKLIKDFIDKVNLVLD